MQTIVEGLKDKHLCKAVFLAGTGGSGKSSVADAMFTALRSPGGGWFKVVDRDTHLTRLMKLAGKELSTVGDHENRPLRHKAKDLSAKQLEQWANRRLPLIIDGTAWQEHVVKSMYKTLDRLGYDCYMVAVVTKLDTALRRNKERAEKGGRAVPEDQLKTTWHAVMGNLKKYKTLFGATNLIIVNNDRDYDAKDWEKFAVPAFRKAASKLIDRPLRNERGKKWIEKQQASADAGEPEKKPSRSSFAAADRAMNPKPKWDKDWPMFGLPGDEPSPFEPDADDGKKGKRHKSGKKGGRYWAKQLKKLGGVFGRPDAKHEPFKYQPPKPWKPGDVPPDIAQGTTAKSHDPANPYGKAKKKKKKPDESIVERTQWLAADPDAYKFVGPGAIKGENRRFMFHAATGTLLLGGKQGAAHGSHAEEFAEVQAAKPSKVPGKFDDYVRGWIGQGGSYKHGVVHFAPPAKSGQYMYDALSLVKKLVTWGHADKMVVRGGPGKWEQPLSAVLGESINEALPRYMYHGRLRQIDAFDPKRTGKGNDQEGPGFYLTDSWADARKYAYPTGYVHVVEVRLRKTVPLTGPVNAQQVRKLLKAAPGIKDTLTDWDEDPGTAMAMLVDSIVNYTNGPHDAFQQVWYEAYRGHEADYLKRMVAMGYDGVEIDKATRGGTQHAVVFNPAALKVVKAVPYAEASKTDDAPAIGESVGKLPYYSDCVGWDTRDVATLQYLIDVGQDVTRQTFFKYADADPDQFPKWDYHIQYYRVPGFKIYYAVHSAIEYVFAQASEIAKLRRKAQQESVDAASNVPEATRSASVGGFSTCVLGEPRKRVKIAMKQGKVTHAAVSKKNVKLAVGIPVRAIGESLVATGDAAQRLFDQWLDEVSPPGFSGTVKAMKGKHPDLDNPYALAWSMYKKGAKPHYPPEKNPKGRKRYVRPETYARQQSAK